MRTVEEIELVMLATSKLILKREMDAEHADSDLKIELYNDIDRLNHELDILTWVLNEPV